MTTQREETNILKDIVERLRYVEDLPDEDDAAFRWYAYITDEAANKIESLRLQLAALKAENEWQPIETAPKDNAVFLAWRKHATHPLMVRYEPSYDWFANYDGEHVYDLTHWMSLPKPPAMSQGEQ